MPTNNYKKIVIQELESGPKLSSFLTEKLVMQFSIKQNTARKSINRLIKSGDIYNSHPLRFLGNQYAYSLTPDSLQYIKLLDNKPKLKLLYSELVMNPLVSVTDFLKIGALLNKGGTEYYDIEKAEIDLKYLQPKLRGIEIESTKFYTFKSDSFDFKECYIDLLNKKRLTADIIPFVLSYCIKINLISKKPLYISKALPFGHVEVGQNIVFDATGLYQHWKSKQGKVSVCI